jgi:hypothetical protein
MSSLYRSGDTGTNRGTSLRRPGDARCRAQIRSDVLHQAAEDLVNKQAQVERRDPLSRDTRRTSGSAGMMLMHRSYWRSSRNETLTPFRI